MSHSAAIIGYDAVRMSCVFVGGMLVIGAFHWWHDGRQDMMQKIKLSEMHVWAMMAGLCGIFAFVPPLLADFNFWLGGYRNPWTALFAAHMLLATQSGFAIQIANNRKMVRRVIFGFYLLSMTAGGLHRLLLI
jgi:hypothetical protein